MVQSTSYEGCRATSAVTIDSHPGYFALYLRRRVWRLTVISLLQLDIKIVGPVEKRLELNR